jgi:hypothetical protein
VDYSNKQASSSPSIIDAEMMPLEWMPPKNGITEAAIEEAMPPEPPPGWEPTPTPISKPSAQEVMPPLPWRHDDLLAAKFDLVTFGKIRFLN